ncbi:hypothetical protein DY000_02031333 [Brassica cretica]|uniref:Uncharacterized protein n=1 Tax=Brassica cretica TaxID=69181 RepID=A0ABQ7DQZ4_BRACR|nr:hypothetical protein DY000_02031333 [Brassica cretica]
MVSQILWLGVKDVFTEIAKDVVGQESDRGTFVLTLRFGMIDNPGRFKDDAGTVIWLFPGSELDMWGDHFSIFREFRSVCTIWLNSYGTIYQDRKNCLRLRSLYYPPSRKYLSSLEDSGYPVLRFACSFALTLFASVCPLRIARILILPVLLCFPGRVLAAANIAGQSRDARDDHEDSPGDVVLATEQGTRGRMVRPWRDANGRIFILGVRSISFLN